MIAAIVAVIVGVCDIPFKLRLSDPAIFQVVPPLHKVFLDTDGALYPSLTQAAKGLGGLL